MSTVPFNLQVIPDSANGTYTFTPQSGGNTVTGSLPFNSESPVINLADGSYILSITGATGYNDYSETVDASDLGASVQLVSTEPVGVGLPSGNNAWPANIPSIPPQLNNKQNSPEFVSPNADYGRYFMSTDARLYIGDTFIDEVDWVQYVVQANQVPVYPYRSQYFAAVGQGRTLVQGQIGLNFISEGYLYAILKNFSKNSLASTSTTADLQTELNNLFVAYQNLQTTQPPSGSSQATTTDIISYNQSQADTYSQRINAIITSMGSNGADAMTEAIAFASGYNGEDTNYCNATYLPIPFDIVLNFTAGGRTVSRQMKNCFLISNEQQVSRDGKIIMDTYGFVAQKLR